MNSKYEFTWPNFLWEKKKQLSVTIYLNYMASSFLNVCQCFYMQFTCLPKSWSKTDDTAILFWRMQFTKLSWVNLAAWNYTKPLLEKKKQKKNHLCNWTFDWNLIVIKIQRLRFKDIYVLCLLMFTSTYILSLLVTNWPVKLKFGCFLYFQCWSSQCCGM